MAAGATYVPLASTTLSSDTGSVTFSSISSSYTDLVIIMSVQGNTGGTAQGSNTNFLRFNGDTASNYGATRMYGATSSSSVQYGMFSNATSMHIGNGYESLTANTTFTPHIINIFNYANTAVNKSVIARANTTYSSDIRTAINVGAWRSTSAVTSVTIYTDSAGGYRTGSIFALYGIAAA